MAFSTRPCVASAGRRPPRRPGQQARSCSLPASFPVAVGIVAASSSDAASIGIIALRIAGISAHVRRPRNVAAGLHALRARFRLRSDPLTGSLRIRSRLCRCFVCALALSVAQSRQRSRRFSFNVASVPWKGTVPPYPPSCASLTSNMISVGGMLRSLRVRAGPIPVPRWRTGRMSGFMLALLSSTDSKSTRSPTVNATGPLGGPPGRRAPFRPAPDTEGGDPG